MNIDVNSPLLFPTVPRPLCKCGLWVLRFSCFFFAFETRLRSSKKLKIKSLCNGGFHIRTDYIFTFIRLYGVELNSLSHQGKESIFNIKFFQVRELQIVEFLKTRKAIFATFKFYYLQMSFLKRD